MVCHFLIWLVLWVYGCKGIVQGIWLYNEPWPAGMYILLAVNSFHTHQWHKVWADYDTKKAICLSFWLNRITWTVEARRTIVCKKISVCPSVLCSITRNVFPWRWLARYRTVHWNVFKQSGRCVQTFIYPDDLDSRYWHTASCTASHTRTWYLLSAKILCLCVSCVLCCCSGAYTESSWAFYILSTSACYSHIKISHQFHSTGRFKSPIPDDSC